MAELRKSPYQGRLVEGETLGFDSAEEVWNTYTLTDGSKMKVKIVMTDVVRLVGEYDAVGNPIYFFTAQQVVAIEANPKVMRKLV